jgi:proline iminopeptidase
VDETVVTDDGVRLWAARVGQGAPVVLCHGGPGLWDMFDDPAAMLGTGTAAYRWDQRGGGRSQRCGPYSTARFVADLDAVRRHFGLERTALLGHSWGAQLALMYALRHPERVSALVYVAGTGIDHDSTWHPAFNRTAREALGDRLLRWEELRGRERTPEEDREYAVLQWSAEFVDRDRALEHAGRMATPWFGINLECNAAIVAENRRGWGGPALRAACERLAVPTLVVDGARDNRPRWAVDSLVRSLPDVSRVVLPDAGHLPWVEAPEAFRSAVAGFLSAQRRP